MLDGVSRCDQLFDLTDCAVCGCESGPWNYRLTFRTQDLSFPWTNSPYGEHSFPRPFVPGTFRSRSSRELLFPEFPGTFIPVAGTFVLRTFRSQDSFSFPGTFVPNINFSLDLSFSWYRPSVRCRRKNTDSSSKSNFLSRRRKKLGRIDVKAASSSLKKSLWIFSKNYCDLLAAITHTKILCGGFQRCSCVRL